MFLSDYHVHSAASFDAGEPAGIEDILKAAAAENIDQIAVCDHYDVNWVLEGTNPKIDFKASRDNINEAKQKINCKTELLLGVELGQPHQSAESDAHARELLRINDFDFVLCAMHNARNEQDFYYIDYTNPDKPQLEAMFERYSRELCELAAWGKFHALAHIDYPVRYFKINKIEIDTSKYHDLYKDVFKIMINRGIILEVNTSGLYRENFWSVMPSFELLKVYKDTGGELLCMGSDAHSAAQLGGLCKRFASVYAELIKIGFKYITVLKNKKIEQIKIEI
ncbi:MAG: histidinol-phosphatase HisJ family protein [Oscillospiraceae bacterium]|nr:histidinol-phosphatase HisJ family protein [Oscillospiraceae bacterium]